MKNQSLISFARRIASAGAALLFVCATAFAQQTISGTVKDASGQAAIGAAVLVEGTTNGVSVDLDGNYTLSVPTGSKLVVSCIGYEDYHFTVVSGKNKYDIVLAESSTMLDETVVIGYGTVKVRDLTGSVAAVSSKDLEVPVANVGEALQGKMAGVVVSLNDATPGAEPQIRIRGSKSITQTNDPLIIVDGFPVGSLANVPSDQIKSINVLKDAAATAIYGSRGAAGVVIVTTKSAQEGQTSVTYNGFVQIKDSSAGIRDVMDTYDYLKFTLGFARDLNGSNYSDQLKYFGIGAANGDHYADYASVHTKNWQNDLYKTGLTHSHNLTISNGTKKNRTMFTMNFLNDDGTVINSWFKRFNASLKTIEKLTDNLDIELNVSYAYRQNRANARLASAFRYRPLEPLGDASVTGGFGAGYDGYVSESANPVELTNNEQNTSYSNNFRGIAAVNWTPLKGLKLRSELGMSANYAKTEGYVGAFGTQTNQASLRRTDGTDMHWTNTISYELPLNGEIHRADVMVGNEWINNGSEYMQYLAQVFPAHFDRERSLAMLTQGTVNNAFTQSINIPTHSLSFFARANYTLLDKYLFTLTFRADGSSKFAPNNRWGYFPAAAFAWRVIDEPFMENAKDWLSNLKLRLSYGVTGSDAISSSLWKESWSLSTSATNYTISDNRTDTNSGYGYAYAPGSMAPNPDLKWESTITRNLGIDFGFLDERIYGTIEGYWSTTNDLLMPINVNSTAGYTYQYQNMGSVSNKGIEFSLGGDIVRTSDFTLSANFIYNYNVNRIEKLSPSVTANTYGQWTSSEREPNTGEYFLREGAAIGSIRGFAYDGWYTTDDFDYDPATGMYTLKEGIPDWAMDSYPNSFVLPNGQNAFPGAAKGKDLNGDKKITADDVYELGEMTPPSNGSFNLSGRWKNLDFAANFNYVIGGHLMNFWSLMSTYGAKDNYFGANRQSFVADAYSPYRWNNGELEFVSDPDELDAMNANATMHTPTSMKGPLWDRWLEDASYLRLKNLTVGYTFPKAWINKIGLKNLRAYFTASNLFTITKYTGLDPEVNTNGSRSMQGASFPTPGVDNNAYPMARTYTIGLNITL